MVTTTILTKGRTVCSRGNGNNNESAKLKSCYWNSLKLAEAFVIQTIAFPNISTGIYRFPKQKAAEIGIKTVQEFESEIIEEVTFICFDEENFNIYKSLLKL